MGHFTTGKGHTLLLASKLSFKDCQTPLFPRKFTLVLTPDLKRYELGENDTPDTSYFEISEELCKTECSNQVVVWKTNSLEQSAAELVEKIAIFWVRLILQIILWSLDLYGTWRLTLPHPFSLSQGLSLCPWNNIFKFLLTYFPDFWKW